MHKKILLIIYYSIINKLPSSLYGVNFFSKNLRPIFIKYIFKSVGKNLCIESNVYFGSGNDISIGNHSGIGINSRIQGPLVIGNHVMIGPNLSIYTNDHAHRNTNIPMTQQGFTEKKQVTIEDDVWIGVNVIILKGVTIGTGSIIAAGSVITKNIPPYSVAAGNPARVIKNRLNDE